MPVLESYPVLRGAVSACKSEDTRAFVLKEEFALPSERALLGFLMLTEPLPSAWPVSGHRQEKWTLCIHFHFQGVFTDVFNTRYFVFYVRNFMKKKIGCGAVV